MSGLSTAYKKNNLFPDIFIATAITLIVFFLFIFFDAMGIWFSFTRAYEEHKLDEFLGLFLGFLMGLLFFTYRLLSYLREDNVRIYKLAESLEYEAFYDYLTALPNRRAFEKKICKLIDEHKINNNSFTLFYIDIDSFKYVNDTLGHEVGDKLLISIVERLSDFGAAHSILARVGGNEFCMVVPGYANDRACLTLCEQLNTSINKPFLIDTHKLHISQTVGISRFPDDGSCYETLLQSAHSAMCMGKISGQKRNNFQNGDFTQAMKMRFIVQHGLKDALEQQQLYVEYQPKVSLSDEKISGSEALVRWMHPEYGFIAPDEFIYIAEEVKMVHLIDFFVLEEVCKQLKSWGDIAKPVAVNLSPILFADENLVKKIMYILNKYEVSPHLIEFEITERTLVADSNIPLIICQKLVDKDVSLSLDDFGTGYSSLSQLADFPISALKIDRSFINQICQSKRTLSIVIAIISLAKALGIKVIAEGVETEEQKLLLKDLACDDAQGYLFDKPLSNDAFYERLVPIEKISA